MSRLVCTFLLAAVLCLANVLPGPARAAEGPTSLMGITLGTSIDKYNDLIEENSSLPLWDQEYLSRVELEHMPGIKSGYVSFANCSEQGTVVRIKVKYEDPSESFFQKLYKELVNKYGEATNRGNAFGTLKVWKWGMKSPNGHSISLILVHSKGDDEAYSYGNTLRLADRTLIDKERQCFKQQEKQSRMKRSRQTNQENPKSFDWYLPK